MPFSFGEETINAGDVISVQCTVAKGDSPITISWYFNNTEIESSDEIFISKIGRKISSLSIESARADHMGEYTCVAKNAAGATNFSTTLHINGFIYHIHLQT
jgi:Immunoglobulin I-set domain